MDLLKMKGIMTCTLQPVLDDHYHVNQYCTAFKITTLCINIFSPYILLSVGD